MAEKFLCTSSSANMTPASGALNAADRPADAPQVIRKCSSSRNRFSFLAMPLPAMPPSWMEGPSLPRDKPPTMHRNPPIIFPRITRYQLGRIYPAISASTCGMPEPEIIGSHLSSQVTSSASPIRTTNQPAIRSGLPALKVRATFRMLSAISSAKRYNTDTKPAKIPTSRPSTTSWVRREPYRLTMCGVFISVRFIFFFSLPDAGTDQKIS